MRELVKLKIDRVDIVDKAANKKRFIILKSKMHLKKSNSFGVWLAGLSQTSDIWDLATKLPITQDQLTILLSGGSIPITPELVQSVSEVFGMPLADVQAVATTAAQEAADDLAQQAQAAAAAAGTVTQMGAATVATTPVASAPAASTELQAEGLNIGSNVDNSATNTEIVADDDEEIDKNVALGNRLRELLDAKEGATVADLAAAGGVSESTANQILSGEIDNPPLDRIEGFAEFLGVSMESLEDVLNRPETESEDEEKSIAKHDISEDEINAINTSIAVLTRIIKNQSSEETQSESSDEDDVAKMQAVLQANEILALPDVTDEQVELAQQLLDTVSS